MSDFYKDLQTVATNVLNTFNQGDIKLVQSVVLEETSPDEAPETEEVVTQLKGTVNGISFKYVDNTFIFKTDMEATVSVIDGITVSKDDFLMIDDVKYKIIEDLTVPSAGVPVVWKFAVRKGG